MEEKNSKTWCVISLLDLTTDASKINLQKNWDLKGQKGHFKGWNSLCLWNSKMFKVKSCLLGGLIYAKSQKMCELSWKN